MQLIRRGVVDGYPSLEAGRATDASDASDERMFETDGFEAYPLAMVEWHDAVVRPGRARRRGRSCRLPRADRGFLIEHGPRVISIAQELLPDGEGFRAVTHIPLPIVQRIVRLDADPR